MSIKDGGPAFPAASPLTMNQNGEIVHKSGNGGMSLRDYFAAAALTGLLSSPLLAENEVHVLAKEAYATADAMMKARREDANTTK